MSQKNNPSVQEEQVVTTVSGIEQFLKKNEKVLEWIIIGVIVVILAFLAINKWYLTPAKEEAKGQMFNAEQLFRAGNYEAALAGDGNVLGFADVASQYGNKAGRIVNFYAGVCALQTGDNESAISYLKKYSTKDKILKARALCCIGDAYSNLGDNTQAVNYYKKAAAVEDNAYAAGYLLKEGITLEEMGDAAGALECYEEIELKYPDSMEGYEIAKYISRVKGLN